MAGEDAVERAVVERQLERVAVDEGRARRLPARDLEHALALVEADDLAAQVARQEAGSAGDVERAQRAAATATALRAPRRSSSQPGRSRSAKRPAPRYQSSYSGARRVVVRLHRFLEYARGAAARIRARTSPRGGTGDDRRARATRSARTRGCSTSTRTRITTARSSRSSATRTSSSRRCSPAIASRRERIDLRAARGRTSAHRRGRRRARSCRSPRGRASARAAAALALARAGRRGARAARCSSTASSAPGRGPAFFRRGGPAELQRRIDAGELAPDFGPAAARRARGRRARRRPPAADRVQRQPARRRRRGRARDRRRRARARRRLPGRARARPRRCRGRARAGEHERRGLGGGRAARDRRARSRRRRARAGRRGRGLGARRPDAGGRRRSRRPAPLLRIDGFDASRVLELRLLDERRRVGARFVTDSAQTRDGSPVRSARREAGAPRRRLRGRARSARWPRR